MTFVKSSFPLIEQAPEATGSSILTERKEFVPQLRTRCDSVLYDSILWRMRGRFAKEQSGKLVTGFTSYSRKMGVTTVASNVALRAADFALGKILLVDANFSNSRIHRIFRCKQSNGLVDYLQGTHDLDDVIVKSSVKDFFVLPAGASASRGSMGIEPSRAAELVKELRDRFDIVVFDLEPAKDLNRSAILARELDSTILVFRANTIRPHEASQFKESLINDQVNLVGSVLTRYSPTLPSWLERFF